jgi:hypothetical protein
MHAHIKIKALILLLVFSLNTLTGMACAAGFNFQTKKGHKHSVKAPDEAHQHGNDKVHAHDHGDVSGHHSHDKAIPAHDHTVSLKHETPTEDECCSDEVIKLSLLDTHLIFTFDFSLLIFPIAASPTSLRSFRSSKHLQ